MKLKSDDLNSILVLVKATGNYTYNRIYNIKDAQAYLSSMKECISILESNLENLDLIRLKIDGLKSEADHLFKDRLFYSRESERTYYNLAIKQSIEAIDSIDLRFIKGETDCYRYIDKKYSGNFLQNKVFQ